MEFPPLKALLYQSLEYREILSHNDHFIYFRRHRVIPPALEISEAFREASIDSDCATSDHKTIQNEPLTETLKSNVEKEDNVADKSLELNEMERVMSKFVLNDARLVVEFGLTGDDIGKMGSGASETELKKPVDTVEFRRDRDKSFLAPRFVMPIRSISGAVSG